MDFCQAAGACEKNHPNIGVLRFPPPLVGYKFAVSRYYLVTFPLKPNFQGMLFGLCCPLLSKSTPHPWNCPFSDPPEAYLLLFCVRLLMLPVVPEPRIKTICGSLKIRYMASRPLLSPCDSFRFPPPPVLFHLKNANI